MSLPILKALSRYERTLFWTLGLSAVFLFGYHFYLIQKNNVEIKMIAPAPLEAPENP